MKEKDDLAVTRTKVFEDSHFDPTNQKYGLFSFSGTLAVSNEPYFRPSPSRKDPDGGVVTGPHNVLVKGPKSGKTNDAFFNNYEHLPDKYKDPERAFHSEKVRTERLKKVHDNTWKPAAYVAEPAVIFPHQASERHTVIKRRLEDGSVRIDQKNFLTSPPKKGHAAVTPGVLLSSEYPHMTDEYDRKLKTAREDARRSISKRHGGAFKSMDAGNKSFNKDETIYGGKFKLRDLKRPRAVSTASHDKPFYPTNPGKKNMTIGAYPEHLADPVPAVTRKSPVEAVPWKSTTINRTRPTPSTLSNTINLRSEFTFLRGL